TAAGNSAFGVAPKVIELGGQSFPVPSPEDCSTRAYQERPELEEQLEAALDDSIRDPMTVIMEGPAGSGKTTLAWRIAAKLGLPLYRFQCDDCVMADNLLTAPRITSTTGAIQFVLQPLAAAAVEGAVCLLDDADKCSPHALSALVSIVDPAIRSLYSSQAGGVAIPVRRSFRLLLAVNDLAAVPSFILDRCVKIHIGYPAIEQTIQMALLALPADVGQVLERAFWKAWRKTPADQRAPLSPRAASLTFEFSAKLLARGRTATDAVALALQSCVVGK
ncbi:MAG: AAA family ATPase, partial [Armatimonadetes bacterium]|nr:AAA family ATPase [Armatimonadota bacterium]